MKRDRFMGVRFTTEQRVRIETAAGALGSSYSDLIRRGTLGLADLILDSFKHPNPTGESVGEPDGAEAVR